MRNCSFCGQPVRQMRYVLGVRWVHYEPLSENIDEWWEWCRVTKAQAKGVPELDAEGGDNEQRAEDGT